MPEVELRTANLGTMETLNTKSIQSALAKAVTHHLAGQAENALSDLDIAIEGGAARQDPISVCAVGLRCEAGASSRSGGSPPTNPDSDTK